MNTLTDNVSAVVQSQNKNAASLYSNDHQEKIAQLETNLQTPLQLVGVSDKRHTIEERMAHYTVPGVSMALIDQGEIVWTRTWGIADNSTQQALSVDTLFQAASISKPVSALGALRMVENGELSLSTPINNYLKRWKLPNNEFTQQEPITLAHLLSHTAGTTVHGFGGYAQSVPQATAIEVLKGSGAANSASVNVDTVPGTNFRYSGGGYTKFQVAMEDVSGKSFTELMDELVLKPAQMTASSYRQPLPKALWANAATGHVDGQVIEGKFHNYPEQAAASLWTTSRDLAKFSLAVIKAARGDDDAFLSPEMTKQFLTSQRNSWGLGPRLYEQDSKVIGFHHGGANKGFRCNSVAFLDGRGAVVMTNSDQGDPLIAEILAAAAEVYDWPKQGSRTQEWFALSEAEKAALPGIYRASLGGQDYDVSVEQHGQGLKVTFPGVSLPNTFYATAREEGVLKLLDCTGYTLSFSENEKQLTVVNIMNYMFTKANA